MTFPSTAAILADQLGAKDAAAYDLSAGCTGFMYALAQAYGMIAAGLSQRALVVGGDVLSRILDWTDRSTVVLFGDGAGAVVLERGRTKPASSASSSAPTARAARTSGCRAAAPAGLRGSRAVREDERPRGLQVRDARPRPVGRGRARALRSRRSTTSTSTSRTRRTCGSSTTQPRSSGSRRSGW